MKNFTFKELCRTDTGIMNNPGSVEIIDNLLQLTENILEPLRAAYGHPIFVSSGYRNPKVNRAVGGANNSQHVLGQAADLRVITNGRVNYAENRRLFELIQTLKLPFDQLINEKPMKDGPSWVHVSFGPRNRRQVLTIR